MNETVKKLKDSRDLPDAALKALLNGEADVDLQSAADGVRREVYGDAVYIRGLIEISNICRCDCLYCGIRRSNPDVERYRLSDGAILACCREGHSLGFRTFVLQGGEDAAFTDERLCALIRRIKAEFSENAVTLSLGERSRESYEALFAAGADRYLLRHETASPSHYARLHPASQTLANRIRCLYDLKEIGYQVGSGFMVGSPFQTLDDLIADLRFLQKLDPDMIGIGPFVSHSRTPFADHPDGSLELTLRLISVLRLMFPRALIPATTALGTVAPDGRERGLCAGANVVMPNLSPVSERKKYELYDNKICTGEEAAQCIDCLRRRVEKAGYRIVVDRGDVNK